MLAILRLLGTFVADLFRPRQQLEVENPFLRHQLNIALRHAPHRLRLRRGPPSQTWRTFLRNHADAIVAIDLCVVPTLTFETLFAFLVADVAVEAQAKAEDLSIKRLRDALP